MRLPKKGTELILRVPSNEGAKIIGKQSSSEARCLFLTDNCSQDYQEMVEKGIQFLDKPKKNSYGTAVNLGDLYGNRIQFLELPNPNLISAQLELPFDVAKELAIINLNFLIKTAENVGKAYPNMGFKKEGQNLKLFLKEITNSTEPFLSNAEVWKLSDLIKLFKDKIFNENHFFKRNFSSKLCKFWSLFEDLIKTNPKVVVNALIGAADKNVPADKDYREYMIDKAANPISKAKNANNVTEVISNELTSRIKGSKSIDALSISGILLMLINQKESHLYYALENLKKAQSILGTKYDIISQSIRHNYDILAQILFIFTC